ncbi:MAG: YbaB/EbfC family nucleoid-associated protein [Patescibacteria group bacterium]
MGFLQKARDMYALQKQSKQIKKELKNTHIEAEADGITVVVTGEQDVLSININETVWGELRNHEFGKKRLEEAAIKALNKALKKAQEIGAAKMKGVWGQLGIGQ